MICRLKWPNDIYWGREVKLGGILCEGSVGGRGEVTLVVGLGINLNNEKPTVCLNHKLSEEGVGRVEWEQLLAVTLSKLEQLLLSCEREGSVEGVRAAYLKHWLHSGEEVRLGEGGELVRLTGVDTFGFLKAEDREGREVVLRDDGNTFDMMRGLIKPK